MHARVAERVRACDALRTLVLSLCTAVYYSVGRRQLCARAPDVVLGTRVLSQEFFPAHVKATA